MKSFVYTSIIAAAFSAIPAQAADESVYIEHISHDILESETIDKEDIAYQSRRGGGHSGIRSGGIRRGSFRRGGSFRGSGFRGRSFGGFRGGFGFGSYIRPFIGFRLPTFWVSPTFFVPNFRTYNLSIPTNGLVWSRYYNDAVLRDQNGFVQQTVPNIQWQGGNFPLSNNGAQNMPIEGQVYSWNEGSNVGGTSVIQSGTVFGAPAGTVTTQVNPGQTVTIQNVSGAPIAQPIPQQIPQQQIPQQPFPQQQIPQGQPINNGDYEQCLRSNGITGAVLGALIGGVAGNRIAGSNARTAGTLIGSGTGALTGLAIESATNKCKDLRPNQTVITQQLPQQQFPQQIPQQQFSQQQFQQQQFTQGQFIEDESGEYAQCLRKRGITGAVLGGLLGGVAGNRIAGRNARTAGTLIGGGLGAISGAAIEKATRKCDKKRVNRGQFFQPVQYYQPPVQYYWVSPGYYYPQATTTVTVTPGTVTTTATEEVVETPTKRLIKPTKRLLKPQG